MKKLAELADIGFLLLLGLFLLGGLAKAILRPIEINQYENRPAVRLQAPTVGGVLDGSFQGSVEEALSDQVIKAQSLKRIYNDASSTLLLTLLSGFLDSHPQRYIAMKGINTFGGDHLVYSTRRLEDITGYLDAKAQGLNALTEAHPELDIYAYYIEKDTDVNFETGEKTGAYEYLLDRLALPPGHMARFRIDSFEEFQQYFYRTDHHWSYKGSYKGYTEAVRLLGAGGPLLEPVEEVLLPYTFSGSKAAGAGAKRVFQEEFRVYRFDYPAMSVTINGEPAGDYGQQEACLAGELEAATYGTFYGTDSGEVVLDTGRPEAGNILLLGESYDNAILKLLASHFGRTYAVDLRYYEAQIGRAFAFSEYVEEHDISTVLFIGNIDYFILEEFLPEG